MSKNDTGLRCRAEALVAKLAESRPRPQDKDDILHELRLHEAELELQNEELRRVQAELDASRARYFDLYDLAPAGYLTISEQGLILEANLTATSFLCVTKATLVSQPFTRFIHKDDQDSYYQHRKELFETPEPRSFDLRMVKADGTTAWTHLQVASALDEKGAAVCRVVLGDISGRVQQEEDVRSFVARTSRGTPEEPFFNALARYLARSLGADFVCIDRLEGDGLNARTLAVWCDGRFEDNVTYALKDTPCGDVAGKEVCCWPASVCQFFPRDQVLKELRAESYTGVTLWSHAGQPIGLIAVIGRHPLADRTKAESLLKLVAERASAEVERLAAEEEMLTLRAAVEQSANTIVITSTDGSIEYANHAFEKSTGYTPAEVLGKNPRILKSGEQDAEFYRNLWETITSGNIWRGEFRNRRKDGSLYWDSATISPVQNDRGDILHFIAVKEDITERKALQTSLANTADRLLLATKAGGVGIWEWDIVNNVLTWDDEMYRLYGISRDRFSGAYEAWRTGLHPDDRERGDSEIQMALRGEKDFDTEFRVLWPNGEIHNIRALAILQRNAAGEPVHMIGTNWDITDHIRAQDELKAALKRAEAAAIAKSEFLSVMSHELRTPLNGVLGFAEILADTPLDEEQQSYIQTINSSGTHLLGVINDILDFSGIESGKLTIKTAPFAVAGTIEASLLTIRKSALEKGIDLRCETAPGTPEIMIGDELRVRQILINLLGNAVKFTARGSVILRVATTTAEGRQFVDFSVEDTGIGISSETLGTLFQPFTRADSSITRRSEGTGLGLAISRRLAEAMGGSIIVASTPGTGSTFTLRLPLEDSLQRDGGTFPHFWMEPGGEAPIPHGDRPVLVVEDDRNCSALAGKILGILGYDAEFASDGAEAVAAFAPGKFSAILMDMAMPVMDGLEATEKIREAEKPSGLRVPIIALTANVMPGEREQCLASGMDDFLAKPFTTAALAAKLRSVVQEIPQ